VIARTVTFDDAAMARAEAATRALLDLSDDFSDVVHEQYRLLAGYDDHHHHHHHDHDTEVDDVYTVASDSLDGGDGHDVLIGDDQLIVETAFTASVGLADDLERFAEGAADAADEIAHAILDLNHLDWHLRDEVVLRQHGKHWHEDVVHHIDLVSMGNDWIVGGGGNDLIVGDSSVTRIGTVHLTAGGSVSWPSDDGAWKDADWYDKNVDKTLAKILDRHHDDHQHWRFEAYVVGSDAIFGGSGDDLVWGDSLALVAGDVTRGAGISSKDWGRAEDDAEDALDSLLGLTDANDYWLDRDHHHDHDHHHHHHHTHAYDDFISGGDGNDILFGHKGEDVIRGDAGDDWLIGGDSRDDVDGGKGKDKYSSGNSSSSSLRKAVETSLVNWQDSFKNFGVPFAPFGKVGLDRHDSKPASFDFLELE
jgi:Ca2+-binding RTX toxin-like protein